MANAPYTAPDSYALPPFTLSFSGAAAHWLLIVGSVWSMVSLYNLMHAVGLTSRQREERDAMFI